MPTEATNFRKVKDKGWRQGSVLCSDLVEELVDAKILPDLQNDGYWIIVSHDCDVTNDSYENEPTVEVVNAYPLVDLKKAGNRTHMKSTRYLCFEDNCFARQGHQMMECDAKMRNLVDRSYLADFYPAFVSLHSDTKSLIARWVANRYVRSAFADNFNERTRKVSRKVRDKAKKCGKWLTGIYLLVSDDELPEGDIYQVAIVSTMRPTDFGDPEKRSLSDAVMLTIESAFNDCEGVDLLASELRSEDNFSMTEFLSLKRWDFDDLSVRDEGATGLPGF